MTIEKVGVVIVAAGESSRMGGIDKIFTNLGGMPLLLHAVDTLHKCKTINEIVIVLSQDNLKKGERMIRERGWSKVSHVCHGGARRQDSVKNGLDCLVDCVWVLIHDGARPFLSQKMIADGLKAARITGAAIPVIPLCDTLKLISNDGFVEQTLTRKSLHLAQTPQVFKFDIISQAYRDMKEDVTDDASLVERLGYRIKVFDGSAANIKVTTPADLIIAEAILKSKTHD